MREDCLIGRRAAGVNPDHRNGSIRPGAAEPPIARRRRRKGNQYVGAVPRNRYVDVPAQYIGIRGIAGKLELKKAAEVDPDSRGLFEEPRERFHLSLEILGKQTRDRRARWIFDDSDLQRPWRVVQPICQIGASGEAERE